MLSPERETEIRDMREASKRVGGSDMPTEVIIDELLGELNRRRAEVAKLEKGPKAVDAYAKAIGAYKERDEARDELVLLKSGMSSVFGDLIEQYDDSDPESPSEAAFALLAARAQIDELVESKQLKSSVPVCVEQHKRWWCLSDEGERERLVIAAKTISTQAGDCLEWLATEHVSAILLAALRPDAEVFEDWKRESSFVNDGHPPPLFVAMSRATVVDGSTHVVLERHEVTATLSRVDCVLLSVRQHDENNVAEVLADVRALRALLETNNG